MIALCSWRKFIYCALCFLKSLVICFCPLLKESRSRTGQHAGVMRCRWEKHHPEKWIFIRPFRWWWPCSRWWVCISLWLDWGWLIPSCGASPSQMVDRVYIWQPTFTWWNNTSKVCLPPGRWRELISTLLWATCRFVCSFSSCLQAPPGRMSGWSNRLYLYL